jgi:integrase
VYISVYIKRLSLPYNGDYVHAGFPMAITDAWLKANSGRLSDKVREKADRDGLGVRVSAKGKIVFQMRYRYDGSEDAKRLDLGTYPAMSLKQARAEHQRLEGKREQGHDPKVIRETEKTAIVEAPLVEPLFRLWYEKYCKVAKKGHHEVLRTFELYVFPKIGKLPVHEVTLHHWLELLEEQAKLRPHIAERILVNAKQMLKFGLKRKLIPGNVLADIHAKGDLQVVKREDLRSLSDEEISRVWRASERSRMAQKNTIFLKLCLFFGCRNGELRLSRKADFDLDKGIWMVPPEHHKLGKKTGKPLLRPIIAEVKPLIEEAMKLSGAHTHMFLNAKDDEPMGKGAPLQLPYNIMQWLRRHEKYEMAHWSVHDLRKTARTNFSSLTQPHIAEIMLGHKLPGTWQTYDHYTYLTEQTAAYNAWWNRLKTLTAL